MKQFIISMFLLVVLGGCQGSNTVFDSDGLSSQNNAHNKMETTPTGYKVEASSTLNHLTGGADGQETLQGVPINSAMLSPLVASFIDTGNTGFDLFLAEYGPPLTYVDEDGNLKVVLYETANGWIPIIPPTKIEVRGFSTNASEVLEAEAKRLADGLVPIALDMEETKRVQFVEGVKAWDATVGALLEAALSGVVPGG